jgi:predicted PurR-regulated permease PerM
MTPPAINQERFQKTFLLLLVVAISAIFFVMVRQFLLAVFLAAIFSGLVHPVYKRLLHTFKGRRALTSALTLLMVFLVIMIPLAGFGSIVAAQALQVSETVRPWIEQQLQQRTEFDRYLDQIPFIEYLRPYQVQITAKLGELAGNLGSFLFDSLAAATTGTATFLFQFFIMLYAMFFFLMNGDDTLGKILYYMPLSNEDESLMLEKFVSVTRATIKGTLVIGAIQGGLAGVAFAIAGIPSATFWGTIMAVLSIIPALGAAIIWIPGVIFLFVTGKVGAGIALAIWCTAVVSSADNFLRPRLVGKDTKMSDLLVLLGTLGGIFLFGIVGVIIGPIIAALFVTVWEIYGVAFEGVLPKVEEKQIYQSVRTGAEFESPDSDEPDAQSPVSEEESQKGG